MASDAKLKANAKYMATLDRIVIQPKKEIGAQIRKAAAEAGQSVQQFILQAVNDRMSRETRNQE